MFWIFCGAETTILALCVVGSIGGLIQVQKLSNSPSRRPYSLDKLLSSVTVAGAYIYSIFSSIAAAVDALGSEEGVAGGKSAGVLAQNGLLFVQVSLQGRIN